LKLSSAPTRSSTSALKSASVTHAGVRGLHAFAGIFAKSAGGFAHQIDQFLI
jgi:hypothetical protein